MFEKETGIKVVYDEFETNEIMYPKVEAGSSAYDVVCPSDYMVQKMIENDLIQELDYDKIPNAKENIGAEYYEQAAAYDPGNKYCVPYCWGTVGIIYNKTLVDTPPTKWADLWDEKYSDEILMMDSIKDCFMVALKKERLLFQQSGRIRTADCHRGSDCPEASGTGLCSRSGT